MKTPTTPAIDQSRFAWKNPTRSRISVHEQATGPKELVVVPGARHIDLYDRTDLIPFDELEEFFTKNLA